ncbi:uroporphyrinogen decarboxylase family protein [Candidatus Bathyarchaeota archaeon]|nr:uroporphyrinogen decarboxylase family protein [Candidatus Bathyarchaeota archaeon]
MTPRERFMVAAKLEEPDQVPVAFLRSTYDAARINLNVKDYIFDYKKKLNAQIRLHERFPGCAFVPGVNPDFGIVAEASAFGSEVFYYENEPPMCTPVVKSAEAIDNLKVPDPYRDGLLPKVLEAYKYLSEHTPPTYGVDPQAIRGPLDLATELRGVGPLLSDMYRNPEYVHRLLDIATQAEIEFVKAMDEVVGESEILFMCDDIPGLISPKFFEEFGFPYMKKIFDAFSKKLKIYHNCKGSMHILERLADTGFQVFNFSFENDTTETKRRIGRRVCLMGNVEPIGIFLKGPRKEIEETCREQIKVAGPNGGYVLSVGGACYGPDQSMDIMIDAASKYGRYPINIE